MSAAEVIEMIKKLPPGEKAEVSEFLRKAEADAEPKPDGIAYASDADFDRAAKVVFAENKDLLRRLAQ